MKRLLIKFLFIAGVVLTQSISVVQAYEPQCWFEGTCDTW